MKRILLFTDILGSGGAQRQLVTLAVLLNQSGYCVKMLDYWDCDFYNKYLESRGIPFQHEPTKGKINIIKMFIRQANEFQPDVVISYMENPSIVACLGRFFINKKFKLIVSERNTTQVNNMSTHLRMNIFRFADYVVPNSYSQRNFIDMNYHFLMNKTVTITNVIDTEKFAPSREKPEPHDTVNFLVVGRIVEQKNVLRFIEALSIAYKQNSKVRVDWYGSPYPQEYYDECKRLRHEQGLDGILTFHPPTQNILAQYIKADAFILPSIYEGYPNVLCEAMSCGLPVIASNVCDNLAIVSSESCGYLFDPLNVKNMAQRILMMASKSCAERREMGVIARNIIEKNFSKKKFIEQYLELIEK